MDEVETFNPDSDPPRLMELMDEWATGKVRRLPRLEQGRPRSDRGQGTLGRIVLFEDFLQALEAAEGRTGLTTQAP
eukprot:gene4864-11510_t